MTLFDQEGKKLSAIYWKGTSSGDGSVGEGPDENIGKQLHAGFRAWYPLGETFAAHYLESADLTNVNFINTSDVRQNATSLAINCDSCSDLRATSHALF